MTDLSPRIASSRTGRCVGVGVGPGDPELVTLKAVRRIGEASEIAWFAAIGRDSNARRVVADLLRADHVEHRLEYPVTTETVPSGTSYETLIADFYDTAAKRIAEVLDAGVDVVVLCEGDPFLYGSFMYLHSRLSDRYEVEVVPGIASMLGASAAAAAPLVSMNEVLSVLSGVLGEAELTERLGSCDAAVIMKVGRNLARVRRAVAAAGALDRAIYVEQATTDRQRIMPLAATADAVGAAPYFSMVLVPSVGATRR